jgi:hypothetical protein
VISGYSLIDWVKAGPTVATHAHHDLGDRRESLLRQRVQNAFREVPLATRQSWDGTKVAVWWFQQVKMNPGIEEKLTAP